MRGKHPCGERALGLRSEVVVRACREERASVGVGWGGAGCKIN